MFGKRLIALGFAGCLGVATSYATPNNTHILQMGSGYEFDLPAQQPQTLSNPFLWEVNAVCVVSSDVDDFDANFKVTRKKGSLNGKKMSAGDSQTLTLHAKDKIKITASPGAEMVLTNLGEKNAHAECTVS